MIRTTVGTLRRAVARILKEARFNKTYPTVTIYRIDDTGLEDEQELETPIIVSYNVFGSYHAATRIDPEENPEIEIISAKFADGTPVELTQTEAEEAILMATSDEFPNGYSRPREESDYDDAGY